MLSNKHKYIFIAFVIVVGAFYYFSQIKEGARGESSNVKPEKITGERNSKKTTSKIDILKKKWKPS
jgi:hypothetical protein